MSAPMSAPMSARMMRQLSRTISTKPLTRGLHQRAGFKLAAPKPGLLSASSIRSRKISTSRTSFKGLQPDQEEPKPVEAEDNHDISEPTPISDAEFHERAELLLEEIVQKMEEMQESRDDVDAEYSVCLS